MSRLEPTDIEAHGNRRGGIAVAVVLGLVAFGAGLLWATHGGEVFLTVIAAGIAACF